MGNPWEEKAQRHKATGIVTALLRMQREVMLGSLDREPTMVEVLHETIKLTNRMSDQAWKGAAKAAGFERRDGKVTCSEQTRKFVISELVGLLPSPLESLEWRKGA